MLIEVRCGSVVSGAVGACEWHGFEPQPVKTLVFLRIIQKKNYTAAH